MTHPKPHAEMPQPEGETFMDDLEYAYRCIRDGFHTKGFDFSVALPRAEKFLAAYDASSLDKPEQQGEREKVGRGPDGMWCGKTGGCRWPVLCSANSTCHGSGYKMESPPPLAGVGGAGDAKRNGESPSQATGESPADVSEHGSPAASPLPPQPTGEQTDEESIAELQSCMSPWGCRWPNCACEGVTGRSPSPTPPQPQETGDLVKEHRILKRRCEGDPATAPTLWEMAEHGDKMADAITNLTADVARHESLAHGYTEEISQLQDTIVRLEGELRGLKQFVAHIDLHLTSDEDFDADELRADLRKLNCGDWIDTESLLIEERQRAEAAERERDGLRRVVDQAQDGNRDLPFDRETGGRMVREAWVRWAQTQPAPKPSWLVPYDELSEPDKEADRQIAEAMGRWTLVCDAARMAFIEMTARAEEPKR